MKHAFEIPFCKQIAAQTVLSLALILSVGAPSTAQTAAGGSIGANIKTFSAMGKEQEILQPDKEVEIFKRNGKGCLTHMWFAMDERVRVRIYVDREPQASVDMALDLGHGYAFGGPAEPFGNGKFGRYGGQFNNFQIPFGDGIRVTLVPMTRVFDTQTGRKVWWILRGADNLTPVVGGRTLPEAARLKLITHEPTIAKPLEEFNLCDVKGGGMLYLVTMSAVGSKSGQEPNLAYMEGCIRGYFDGSAQPDYLSSGLEDYFLGSGYFHQNQRYYGQTAGLTYIDKLNNAFSAYRFHDEDPVFFQKSLRLTCRCGETASGKPIGNPQTTEYRTYTWLYLW